MININKVNMTYEDAMAWVERAIAQDQKDIAIRILKDILQQAILQLAMLKTPAANKPL